jgi:cytoskeletal protein RodZ
MAPEQTIEQNRTDLKTAREMAGFTLKDMYERTRISVANLEAIEKSDFHLLPVPIYARNFIKTYADALGVDSRPVLQRYESYLQSVQMKENEKMKESSTSETVGSTLARYKIHLWALCIIILFALVSLFISFYRPSPADVALKREAKKDIPTADIQLPISLQPENQPVIGLPSLPEKTVSILSVGENRHFIGEKLSEAHPNAPIDSKPVAPQIKPPAEGAIDSSQRDAAAIRALVDSQESSVIAIRAVEETWIRVKSDDKEPFQVLLKEGEKVSYQGARFQLHIGNAAGVKIQFNGKTFENLGKSGQVIHLRLP